MTPFEQYKAAVEATPGARLWIEGIVIRGTRDGTIAGAHVDVGAELVNPLMPAPIRAPDQQFGLDVLAGDFAAVMGATAIAQQATIADRDATITTMTTDRATADARIAELEQQLAAATASQAAVADPANPPLTEASE